MSAETDQKTQQDQGIRPVAPGEQDQRTNRDRDGLE
jgi:hypothetical protein